MKKGTSVIGIIGKIIGFIIILSLAAPWVISSIVCSPFAGPKGNIYVHDEDNQHYIAQFKATHQLCIYHYIDPTDDLPSIAGVKTEYRCEGAYYNPLIGPIHVNPDPGILFWKNFAFFKDGEKKRAAIKVTSVDNYVAFATDDAAVIGTFYDDISIGEDFIILSGQKFVIPEGVDLKFAEQVIEWFDTYAQPV